MKAPNKLKFTDYQLNMIQGLTVTDESRHEYIHKDKILVILKDAKNLADVACKIDKL